MNIKLNEQETEGKRLVKILVCGFKLVFSWIFQREISANRLALVGMASGRRPLG